jgi:CRP-like cAMP-binding protein
MAEPERVVGQEIFKHLRAEQISEISAASEVVKFKRGDMIYRRGQKAGSVYVVLEGRVALRMPGNENFRLAIDTCDKGDLFGTSVFFNMDNYVLDAQCTEDSEVLKIDFLVLKNIMDRDRLTGLAIQTQIAKIYYNRYINTMEKLQAILMSIPLETA